MRASRIGATTTAMALAAGLTAATGLAAPGVSAAGPAATGPAATGPALANRASGGAPHLSEIPTAQDIGGLPAVAPALAGAYRLPRLTTRPAVPGAAPTYAQCRAQGLYCYSPRQMRAIYGVDRLTGAGDTGRGRTIVIVDALGSRTLAADLRVFDRAYGLRAADLHVLAPFGRPRYSSGADQAGWAGETSLDVEWAHAIAPGARIDLLETAGTTDVLRGFLRLDDYAFTHHLGQVLSQSWGAAEERLEATPGGRAVAAGYGGLYRAMAHAGWSVFAASGDHGTANTDGTGRRYRYPTVVFPAASPEVTSVGGTAVAATAAGRWQAEVVWHDAAGAGGGGVSRYFAEPAWQRSLPRSAQAILRGRRGVPDVAWDADPATGVWTYCTAVPGCSPFRAGSPYHGYNLVGGTSFGSPAWAALTADLDQASGHAAGLLNPTLYRLERRGVGHDVVRGDNAAGGLPGYAARPGWDAASGLGTPGRQLVAALLAAER